MFTVRRVLLVLLRIMLVVFAIFSVFLTARLVIVYFGPAIDEIPITKVVLALAKVVTINFVDRADVPTPYGGYFEINTCFSLLFYLVLEPVGERVRRAIDSWSPKRIARD